MKDGGNKMSEITVIIPAYNAEKYIGECLQSLHSQIFNDMDVLVINDSSTDETVQVVEEFQKKHPKFMLRIITVPNGGAAKARNTGIRMARGNYIAFMDADDVADSNMLKAMIDVAHQENADLVTCDFFWMYPNKNVRQMLYSPKNNRELYTAAWAAPWNKLYRRTMLVDHDVFFTEGYTYEDTSFYLKYIPYCNIVKHIARPFIYWRQHSTSTMGKNQDKRIPQIFLVLDDAINYYKEQGCYQEYESELEYFCAKLLWGSSIYRICQVRDTTERKKYISMTLDWLRENFPDWKKNVKFKTGVRGIYMRSINVITANIYANCIYYIRYFGRKKM